MNENSDNYIKPFGVGGSFLKIIETSEIVRWQEFNPKTQIYTVTSSNGKNFTVRGDKVSKHITADEEVEFIRSEADSTN